MYGTRVLQYCFSFDLVRVFGGYRSIVDTLHPIRSKEHDDMCGF